MEVTPIFLLRHRILPFLSPLVIGASLLFVLSSYQSHADTVPTKRVTNNCDLLSRDNVWSSLYAESHLNNDADLTLAGNGNIWVKRSSSLLELDGDGNLLAHKVFRGPPVQNAVTKAVGLHANENELLALVSVDWYSADETDTLSTLTLDSDGTIRSIHTYNSAQPFYLHSTTSKPDGGALYIAHGSGTNGSGSLLVNFDADGTIIWQRWTEHDDFVSLNMADARASNNGSVFAIGNGLDNGDLWLIKFDISGNIEWSQRLHYGDALYGLLTAYQALPTEDGGVIILTGYESIGSILLKLNFAGDLLWAQQYGHGEDGNRGQSGRIIHQSSESTWLLGGMCTTDFCLAELTYDGTVRWTRKLDMNYDQMQDMLILPDGAIVVAGNAGQAPQPRRQNQIDSETEYTLVAQLNHVGEMPGCSLAQPGPTIERDIDPPIRIENLAVVAAEGQLTIAQNPDLNIDDIPLEWHAQCFGQTAHIAVDRDTLTVTGYGFPAKLERLHVNINDQTIGYPLSSSPEGELSPFTLDSHEAELGNYVLNIGGRNGTSTSFTLAEPYPEPVSSAFVIPPASAFIDSMHLPFTSACFNWPE